MSYFVPPPMMAARPQRPKRAPRPKAPAKAKPMSEQTKAKIAKEVTQKDHSIKMSTIDSALKGGLHADDVRNHLSQAELNELYYQVIDAVNSCHGRFRFEGGNGLAEGRLELRVRLRASASVATKMSVGILTRQTRAKNSTVLRKILEETTKEAQQQALKEEEEEKEDDETT